MPQRAAVLPVDTGSMALDVAGDMEALMEAVRELVLAAGRAVATIYAGTSQGVVYKADGSPVTSADLAAQQIIAAGLARLTPDIPVISEESMLPCWEQRRQWARHWLVDPLDGTREFVAGTGEFSVNVALIEGATPVLGVVGAPMTQTVWMAVGGRAFRVDGNQRQRLYVRQPASPWVVVTSRRNRGGRNGEFVEKLRTEVGDVTTCTLGSSLKICRIAEGDADVYPRFGATCEWDTAAAHAILVAAGGELIQADMQPLHYHKENLLNPEFMAIGRRADWHFLPRCWP